MEAYQEIMEAFAEEFGMEAEAVEEQRFTIDSDAKAEWAIRKIAEEEAECQRLCGVCQAEIDRYRERKENYEKRCEGRTANLRAMLLLYFGTVPVKESKTQQKYELPSGSLVMKKASHDFKANPERLRVWLEANQMTDYLKVEVSPKWALVKKQLSADKDGSIVFTETGEIIPTDCVAIEKKPARFEVKAK